MLFPVTFQNRRVRSRWQRANDGGFEITGRWYAGIDDRLFLIIAPVVVDDGNEAIITVQFEDWVRQRIDTSR